MPLEADPRPAWLDYTPSGHYVRQRDMKHGDEEYVTTCSLCGGEVRRFILVAHDTRYPDGRYVGVAFCHPTMDIAENCVTAQSMVRLLTLGARC